MKLKILLSTLLFFIPLQAFSQELDNLKAFAKLYGYVRFFHPSEEAAKVNWDKFAIHGVERMLKVKNKKALLKELNALFLPAAPTAAISKKLAEKKDPEKGVEYMAWRHFGVQLSSQSNIYRSKREKSSKEKLPPYGVMIREQAAPGLFCEIPLTLPVGEKGTQGPISALLKKLETVDLKKATADDINVRLANVIITWNVMQHFYPYFDVVDVDWEAVLDETLALAMKDKSANEFFGTLKKMIARLEDGHGVVYFYPKPYPGGLPIRVEWIEGKTVITASGDETRFKKGDVIKSIDNTPGEQALLEAETYVSGSPQLKRFRALNQFGQGPAGSKANLEIIRDGKTIKFEYERPTETRNMFFNKFSEFKYPGIKEIEKGIYYVNLNKTPLEDYESKINELAEAKGVIFDYRWDGVMGPRDMKRISPHTDVIPHLVQKSFTSAQWHIPVVIYPNQKEVEFSQSNWNLLPKKPFFKGTSVFIVEPSVVSYGESCLGIVEHYKTSEIVGTKSAGCNGNANFINLPGKFRIMWTGMKVLKHDGSQHHLVGIDPTYPVEKTIQAVKEGRDLYLEKAIEVIHKGI